MSPEPLTMFARARTHKQHRREAAAHNPWIIILYLGSPLPYVDTHSNRRATTNSRRDGFYDGRWRWRRSTATFYKRYYYYIIIYTLPRIVVGGGGMGNQTLWPRSSDTATAETLAWWRCYCVRPFAFHCYEYFSKSRIPTYLLHLQH